ncbi:alpha/beta hydrolase family protein [Oceanicaulis sp.]|uniref:alpha/beta hydrolase family protein n=1 Tax=Oceanicaulis sp. TaxID=1924941 RepID=UPI003F729970
MKLRFSFSSVLVGTSLLLGAFIAGPASATVQSDDDLIPLEYFAVRENMTNVELSPDGRHLALMRIPAREANPLIEIYQTDDFSAQPRRLNADPMEFQSLQWVSSDLLIVGARQKIRNRIDGFNRGVYAGKVVSYSLESGEFEELSSGMQVEALLPGSPDEVIVSLPRTRASFSDDDPFIAFRPRAYYRFNLETGQRQLIINGNQRIATAVFDDEGNPRFASGYDAGAREFVYYYRGIGDEIWEESYRVDGYDLSTFTPVSFDQENEDLAYVLAHNGHDKIGFWEFNLASGEFGELIYRREDSDVAGIRFHSNFWGEGSAMAGVNYFADRIRTAWIDPDEEALFAGLRQAIPNAHQLSVTSRSRDGSKMVVFNRGPRDPGSYYYLSDGAMRYLGGYAPQLEPEMLADVEYIQYPSRHGDLMIPAYLTVPHGEPPFPLIVLPHGGPFVSEVITYDEWGQFLASRGYMVLQPQYRGSLGHGLQHYTSALGQAGLAMQDDKDDGALYLVEQGLADPDRLAMFGWSYGGYAALVAASREDNIYQCAIAGAAVADPNMQLNYYRDGLLPFQEEFELRRRDGIQPIDEVENVNIPLFLIHGDVDQRVPLEHMRVYIPRLERAGIPYRYLELEGADHFSNTLFYNHQTDLYTGLEEYLANDCGPGGL